MNAINERFSPLQRALHWIMAICILAMLFIGVGMVSTVKPDYLTLVSIHKPLGIAILVLALIRLAVRIARGAPPLPANMPEPMKLAAHLSHYAFYALMIAMPLLGYGDAVGGGLSGRDVRLRTCRRFCRIAIQLHTLLWNAHRFLALCFFALIVVHLAAALFHALVRRDGVFRAMAPWK